MKILNKDEEKCLNKVRYDTKEKAIMAYQKYTYLAGMKRSRGRRVNKIKHKQRPYKCEHCGGWHLTTIKS